MNTFRHVGTRVYRIAFPIRLPPNAFDLENHVDTGGLISGMRLNSGHPNDRFNTAYSGTPPSFFYRALEHWQSSIGSTPLSDYTFVDVGCGKGRAVMLASTFSFRQALGVELNPALAATARRNLTVWQSSARPCADLDILTADALEFPVPLSPVVFYVFNPFGAPVVERFLARLIALAASRTSVIDIIYVQPEHITLFAAHNAFQLLWDGEISLSPEDTAADVFRSFSMRCCIYRLSPTTH